MAHMTLDSAIAVNRFGLGAAPGERAGVGADPRAWLAKQAGQPAPAYPEFGKLAHSSEALKEYPRWIASLRTAGARTVEETFRAHFGPIMLEEFGARLAAAAATPAPFHERLVWFWANHFTVSAEKPLVFALVGSFEREAIRPHVTGRFADMLLASATHPAMIMYLDNHLSVRKGWQPRQVGRSGAFPPPTGLNENLAREILELHTLGVDGGYDQHDVTEFAKVLTGWSIGGDLGQGAGPGPRIARALGQSDGGDPGEFHFRPFMHEPDDKTVLGKKYAERGVDEGEAVLEMLALHASTARHLATKLARHFVADEPPANLVDELANSYLESGGELVPVYQTLIRAEASWREPLAKFKTPQDFVISTFRAVGAPPDSMQRITGSLEQLGQRPFTPGSPAGWPDTAAHWDSGDALLKRIEWADTVGRTVGERLEPVALGEAVLGATLGEHSTMSIARAESRSQALALMLASPEFQRR